MDYLDDLHRIIVQTFLIKQILGLTICRDTIETVMPDYNVVYTVDFELNNVHYILFNFLFQGKSHGFIIRNGCIVYQIKDGKMNKIQMGHGINSNAILNSDKISDSDHDQIMDWYQSKADKINYVNYGNIFYLGDG